MTLHHGAARTTVTQELFSAPKRILTVDDEPKIRSFISRALTAAGYATDSASTGTEGLRQALAGHYDLIILDLVMPDMKGPDFLDRLLSQRPDQAVMVLSCLADVPTKVDCLERGAQDYLTKPFSLAELLARVRVRLRVDAHPHDETARAGEVIRAGELTLDVGTLLATVWGYDFDPGSNVVDVCVRRLRSKLGFDLIKTVRGEGYQLVVR